MQEKDVVLVKIVAHKGRHKLQDKWEPEEYVVVEQPIAGTPVTKFNLLLEAILEHCIGIYYYLLESNWNLIINQMTVSLKRIIQALMSQW